MPFRGMIVTGTCGPRLSGLQFICIMY